MYSTSIVNQPQTMRGLKQITNLMNNADVMNVCTMLALVCYYPNVHASQLESANKRHARAFERFMQPFQVYVFVRQGYDCFSK